jgi:tRNA(His) 5'-end guanylyltransferase
MISAAEAVMNEAMGSKLAYIQSDEISILLTDYENLESEAWFNNNIQKLCSVSASIASVEFSSIFKKAAHFDCRVFNIPKEEVNNYFIWRQQDWMRNSVQMLARSYFSQLELNAKNIPVMHDMLHTKGIHWRELEPKWKNGTVITGKNEKHGRILTRKNEKHGDFIFKDNWDRMKEIIG